MFHVKHSYITLENGAFLKKLLAHLDDSQDVKLSVEVMSLYV